MRRGTAGAAVCQDSSDLVCGLTDVVVHDHRIELGLGSGWYEAEHRAYGIPFPARRFDLLEDQLAILDGVWTAPAVVAAAADRTVRFRIARIRR